MLHSHRLLKHYNTTLTKFFVSSQKTKQITGSNVSSVTLKPGYLNYVRLESGEEICLVRSVHMKPITIDLNSIEKFCRGEYPKRHYNNDSEVLVQYLKPQILNDCKINNLKDPPQQLSFNLFTQNESYLSLKHRYDMYMKLGKFRLTTLVVTSCICGFVMAPSTLNLNMLLCVTTGTFFTSLAANTLNQILEIPFDSQMMRTRYRPLVLGKITPLHATIFAVLCASTGSIILLSCNQLTCFLGVSNLALYTFIYTPLKRISISNTWLGAVVGGIPPLMGWAAATDHIHLGGLLMFSMLFCWQFPHFMALSWNLKSEYAKAGYQMASTVSPRLCRSAALHYSILMSLLCPLAPIISLTDWGFAIESLPFNIALCTLAFRFYSNPGSSSSRKLFKYSLVYLPIIMVLLIFNKSYYYQNDKLIEDIS